MDIYVSYAIASAINRIRDDLRFISEEYTVMIESNNDNYRQILLTYDDSKHPRSEFIKAWRGDNES